MEIKKNAMDSLKNLDIILLAVVVIIGIAVIAPTGISGEQFMELMKMVIPALVSAFTVNRAHQYREKREMKKRIQRLENELGGK